MRLVRIEGLWRVGLETWASLGFFLEALMLFWTSIYLV